MKTDSVTLGELIKLTESLEDGGASGLSDSDLAFVGAEANIILRAAQTLVRKLESEANFRLSKREADVIASNGSSITRTWKNDYSGMDVPALFERVLSIDATLAGELFEYVPAKVVPAELKVHSTLKLRNWIEKLGTSGDRVYLEEKLGATRKQPSFVFKAVDPETGEVFS